MKENELYRRVMQGVDIDAAAASFWAAHPPSSVRSSVSQSLQVSRSRAPHAPRASSHITPSEHRPLVLASDRLLLWSTPSGQSWQADLESKYPNSSLFRLFQVRPLAFIYLHHPNPSLRLWLDRLMSIHAATMAQVFCASRNSAIPSTFQSPSECLLLQ